MNQSTGHKESRDYNNWQSNQSRNKYKNESFSSQKQQFSPNESVAQEKNIIHKRGNLNFSSWESLNKEPKLDLSMEEEPPKKAKNIYEKKGEEARERGFANVQNASEYVTHYIEALKLELKERSEREEKEFIPSNIIYIITEDNSESKKSVGPMLILLELKKQGYEKAMMKKMKISFAFEPKAEKKIPAHFQDYEHDDFLMEQIEEKKGEVRREKLLFIRIEDPNELVALHQIQDLDTKSIYLYFRTPVGEFLFNRQIKNLEDISKQMEDYESGFIYTRLLSGNRINTQYNEKLVSKIEKYSAQSSNATANFSGSSKYFSDSSYSFLSSIDSSMSEINSGMSINTSKDSKDYGGLLDTNELNDSQKSAVRKAIESRLTLIQGPPGTGKTHTAAVLAKVLHKYLIYSGKAPKRYKILITAQSNAGVDNLGGRLSRMDLKVTKIVGAARAKVEARTTSLSIYNQLQDMIDEEFNSQGPVKGNNEEEKKSSGNVISKSGKRIIVKSLSKYMAYGRQMERIGNKIPYVPEPDELFTILQEINDKKDRSEELLEGEKKIYKYAKKILDESNIICSTLSVLDYPLLKHLSFPFIIIDEASQASEPEALFAFNKHPEKLIMFGDHCQLGPTVMSKEAESMNLRHSLFERLFYKHYPGTSTATLEIQYRMDPGLVEFINKRFYQGKLKTSDLFQKKGLKLMDVMKVPNKKIPIIFFNQVFPENKYEEDIENPREAETIVKLIDVFLKKDIGVITPYNGQLNVIKDKLYEKYCDEDIVEVNTVDGFQGREKDFILLSMVRCNSEKKAGFLSDRSRLNVSISRARRGLVIVGHADTLKDSWIWKEYLDHLHKNGCIIDIADQNAADSMN